MSEETKPEGIDYEGSIFNKDAERKRLIDNLRRVHDEEHEIGRLSTVEARYKDLLNRLGVQGHDGAIAEINALRIKAGLSID